MPLLLGRKTKRDLDRRFHSLLLVFRKRPSAEDLPFKREVTVSNGGKLLRLVGHDGKHDTRNVCNQIKLSAWDG